MNDVPKHLALGFRIYPVDVWIHTRVRALYSKIQYFEIFNSTFIAVTVFPQLSSTNWKTMHKAYRWSKASMTNLISLSNHIRSRSIWCLLSHYNMLCLQPLTIYFLSPVNIIKDGFWDFHICDSNLEFSNMLFYAVCCWVYGFVR